jgi:CRP-like cAMP-binding protein
MSDHDLSQIAGITEEKRYESGEVIIEERTTAERFFIILRGKIEITKRFDDGEQLVLAVHSDGEFFGEMALLDEGLRSATARAVEATSLLEISRPEFETLLYKAPVLAYRILKELSSRLRETGALLVSHLRRRNRQLYRAYLDTVSAFLEGVEARDPLRRGRTARLRAVSRALAGELGVADEDMLLLEIAVVLRELDLSAYPANLPARPGPQLQGILEVAAAFEALRHPAASGRPGRAKPAAGEARAAAQALAESGSDLDPQALRALQHLAETGRLP